MRLSLGGRLRYNTEDDQFVPAKLSACLRQIDLKGCYNSDPMYTFKDIINKSLTESLLKMKVSLSKFMLD